jgi:hypothetical protein
MQKLPTREFHGPAREWSNFLARLLLRSLEQKEDDVANGPFAKCRDVRSMSAVRGKADIGMKKSRSGFPRKTLFARLNSP